VVKKHYKWDGGAELDDHTRRKHKILKEYFFEYLTVRCQKPQQERFRLAVIDGFSGAGRYKCGTAGSPIIFVEVLKSTVETLNIQRIDQGLKALEIECLLILNDASRNAVELLKQNIAPLLAEIRQNNPKLTFKIEYLNDKFEIAYPNIKALIEAGRYRNVLFNLDQCGHSLVDYNTLDDIMRSYRAEIFYTFAIEALLAFLRKNSPAQFTAQLVHIGLTDDALKSLEGLMSNKTWLGTAERIVFETFNRRAAFVSPFTINNPDGWKYWLIHFASSYRARQVYNNILHKNSSEQAHFGRSGLNMLSYDPTHEAGSLYLFDRAGRETAKQQLLEDIPRLISQYGDVLAVEDFYENIYNDTPAHTEDIHAAIIENPDLEVITKDGGERRKAHTISVTDTLKLKNQKSFFQMFNDTPKA
jgi:three-Cys-motif partner protein